MGGGDERRHRGGAQGPGRPVPLELRVPAGGAAAEAARQEASGRRERLSRPRQRARAACFCSLGLRRGGEEESQAAAGGGGAPDGHVPQQLGSQ